MEEWAVLQHNFHFKVIPVLTLDPNQICLLPVALQVVLGVMNSFSPLRCFFPFSLIFSFSQSNKTISLLLQDSLDISYVTLLLIMAVPWRPHLLSMPFQASPLQ